MLFHNKYYFRKQVQDLRTCFQKWVIDCIIEKLIDWLFALLAHWLIDWLNWIKMILAELWRKSAWAG